MTKRDLLSLWVLLLASSILLSAILTAPAATDRVPSRNADLERPREELREGVPAEEPRVQKVQLVAAPSSATDAEAPATSPPIEKGVSEPAAAPGGADSGAFPEIVADYRTTVGFEAYLSGLARVGARFFVIRRPAFRIVAEVDPSDLSVMAVDRPLDSLSPRSRELSEPKLEHLLARASREFGDGTYAVISLFPVSLERRLMHELGGLARAVPSGVDSFSGEYRFDDRDGLVLRVLQMKTKNGEIRAADRSIPLGVGF